MKQTMTGRNLLWFECGLSSKSSQTDPQGGNVRGNEIFKRRSLAEDDWVMGVWPSGGIDAGFLQ